MKRVSEDFQKRSLRWLLGTGAVFVVALLAAASAKSYQDLRVVLERKAELQGRLDETEARTAELEFRLELLRRDPATLERLAREELGMVGPDELVFVLEDGSADTDGASPSARID